MKPTLLAALLLVELELDLPCHSQVTIDACMAGGGVRSPLVSHDQTGEARTEMIIT